MMGSTGSATTTQKNKNKTPKFGILLPGRGNWYVVVMHRGQQVSELFSDLEDSEQAR